MKLSRRAFAWLLFLAVLSSWGWGATRPDRPRLVVQIVVDGLGQQQLLRQWDDLDQGGFRTFLEQGAWYTQSRYQHATTLTAVGHATIPTGAHPSDHGIIGNDWADRLSGKRVYCVEDPAHRRLDEPTPDSSGTSPLNLRATTIGDELRLATNLRSKVFGISIKDRSAILPAGKLGQAFFFSNSTGRFITTDYYMTSYPQWWRDFYGESPQDQWAGRTWEPLSVNRTEEAGKPDFSVRLPSKADGGYYSRLPESPFANDYLLQFALAVVDGENLGKNPSGVPDFLSISLSTHDYINHGLGPESPQSVDNILRMDRTLAAFFSDLGNRIGREYMLLVLTADHGFGSNPEDQAEAGLEAGRISTARMEYELNRQLSELYGGRKYVFGFYNPTVYLDIDLIKSAGLSVDDIEEKAGEILMDYPGIAWVFTRRQLLHGLLPAIPLAEAAQLAWNPQLSGDLFVIQKSGWFLLRDGDGLAATHGSPYHYDTDVPLMFAGPWIQPGKRGESAYIVDLAPTLAAILDVRAPSASAGRVLTEILAPAVSPSQ